MHPKHLLKNDPGTKWLQVIAKVAQISEPLRKGQGHLIAYATFVISFICTEIQELGVQILFEVTTVWI